MEIQSVRYTVETNDQVEIIFDDASTYSQPYNEIRYRYTDQLSDWERGASQAWVADEAAYNDYRSIMDYNPASGEPAPIGYNSPEQVAESQAAHDNWVSAKAAWDDDPLNGGEPYPVPEPTILLSPSELPPVDPPVPAEGDLNPNQISEYDPNFNVSDDQLRQTAYAANNSYADSLVFDAEHSPTVGDSLDDRETDKENDRRNNRAKQNNKLSAADDHLGDHVDSLRDAQDQADDIVENLNRQELIDWDASAQTYPTWSPYQP